MLRSMLVLAVSVVLTGCASRCCAPVQYAMPEPVPADATLQACANHAAAAARASGQDFTRLQLTTANRFIQPMNEPVGRGFVGMVQDGMGQWYGRKQWMAVRYHCLTAPNGQVLYSFVRAE